MLIYYSTRQILTTFSFDILYLWSQNGIWTAMILEWLSLLNFVRGFIYFVFFPFYMSSFFLVFSCFSFFFSAKIFIDTSLYITLNFFEHLVNDFLLRWWLLSSVTLKNTNLQLALILKGIFFFYLPNLFLGNNYANWCWDLS